jgi:hypothetical protein
MAQGDPTAARAAWETELGLVDTVFAGAPTPEALRFRAVVASHLAGAGGANASAHRRAAITHLDALSRKRGLTDAEAALLRRMER